MNDRKPEHKRIDVSQYLDDGPGRIWVDRHYLIWQHQSVQMNVPVPRVPDDWSDEQKEAATRSISEITLATMKAIMEHAGETEMPRVISDRISMRVSEVETTSNEYTEMLEAMENGAQA